MTALSKRDLFDLLIRFLLALTFAVSAGIYFQNGWSQLAHNDTSEIRFILKAFSMIMIGLYTLIVAILYVVRLQPINKFAGIGPCAAAILGGFLMSGVFLLTPRNDLPLGIEILASGLVIIGNISTVFILIKLGRSFSILPESRHLVTSGPYQIVRHPVYLAEAISTLGVLIHFLSPWALILVFTQIGLQLIRIHSEEKVLKETFPEYATYARKVKRLIPGLY